MALLTIENVRKFYGSNLVLDGISLQVAQGECVALLGPSGCGKTTLLNIVAGFLEPNAGAILLDGTDIVRTPPHKRNMGMVFQDYALFPHLDVSENVEFGLRMRGVPRQERRVAAAGALELVGLSGMEKRSIRQLSGGQQQRVAVARALVNQPKLLLFDEPLSNLDARLRDTMRTEIRALLDRTRISAIFVTHDQAEAFAIADKVALFNKGRLVQIGPADELYEHPATSFAASFLGGCNLIPGTIARATEGEFLVSTTLNSIVAVRGGNAGARAGSEVMLAVRPHHISLGAGATVARPEKDEFRNRAECAVEMIEYLGASSRVTLRHQAGQRLLAEVDGRPSLQRGDVTEASWAHVHTWPIFEGDHG